jgi:CDP-diacylglycerol--glycerol-3-phosphate 3-phosphatidyltransferase/cardiolipin synthase
MTIELNAPILLTLIRIGLIPIFVLVFYLPFQEARVASALVFVLAALTDWLDGLLARRWGQSSAFGAFLDPVADKLMVAVALVLLVQAHPTPWLALPAAVIVGREIVISALREWMAEIGKRAHVAVSIVAKCKTTVQMVAIMLLLYREPMLRFPTLAVGFLLLYVAVALTLWSMAVYLRTAWLLLNMSSALPEETARLRAGSPVKS